MLVATAVVEARTVKMDVAALFGRGAVGSLLLGSPRGPRSPRGSLADGGGDSGQVGRPCSTRRSTPDGSGRGVAAGIGFDPWGFKPVSWRVRAGAYRFPEVAAAVAAVATATGTRGKRREYTS